MNRFFIETNSFYTPIYLEFFFASMWRLSCLFKKCCLLSFGNDRGIGGHHTKKYPALFSQGVSCINFLQQVMVLFVSKAAFQSCWSFFIQHSSHCFALFYVLFFLPALRYKVGNNTITTAISSVGIGGIYFIGNLVGAFAK